MSSSPTSTALRRILSLLESIKNSDAGAVLYAHIESTLCHLEGQQHEAEKVHLTLLNTLLDNLSTQLPNKSPQQVQLYILKKSLTPGMSNADLNHCTTQLESLLGNINYTADTIPGEVEQSLESLIDDISRAAMGQPVKVPPSRSQEEEVVQNSFTSLIDDMEQRPRPAVAAMFTEPDPEPLDIPGLENGAPFCFADAARDNIEAIHATLAEQIEKAREFNNELARLLSSSLSVINQIDKHEDMKVAKQTFLRRYTKLIKMHQDLTTKFDTVDDNLASIESNSENLSAELNRVHRLSYTDELTGLPNRRALLQRMNDEMARSRRYHSPLTMAIVDLDHFKSINDNHGHKAGDCILQLVAQHMKAIFRYHDIAARYGGEEFAVLFPNTNIEGATLALNKLQDRLGNDICILDDNSEIPVPTFSAGLALFNGEEEVEELIHRADTALYDAKNCGRCRIETHINDVPDWPDEILEQPR